MKKTLFALALAGVFAGAAQAQSHVTVYGIVDTGIAKQTGKDTYMTHNYESSLGFRGPDDLGNGDKAMFQLEHRLNLNDGLRRQSRHRLVRGSQCRNRHPVRNVPFGPGG